MTTPLEDLRDSMRATVVAHLMRGSEILRRWPGPYNQAIVDAFNSSADSMANDLQRLLQAADTTGATSAGDDSVYVEPSE